MQVISRQLPRHELGAYADHLLALDADDRRLRFGQAIHDASTHAVELLTDRVGRFDHLLESQALALRQVAAAWLA